MPAMMNSAESLAEASAILARGVVRLRLRNAGRSSAPAESFAYTIRTTNAVMQP